MAAAGPWTMLSSGTLALPDGRNITTAPFSGQTPIVIGDFHQDVTFTNSSAYTSYRVTFPTLKNAGVANSMQIAEVELLGTVVREPSAAVVAICLAAWVAAGRRRR